MAAIMFTDMVGYTTLGQMDEPLSLLLVEEQRKLIRPILRRHNGREVKSIGDAFLVEFASALEAVNCAIEIQTVLKEVMRSSPEERKFNVRIGIHLGDVVHRGGDVAGDAVNVASRIEPLSPPGGVCVSAQVYQSVVNKIECEFVSLGVPELRNVTTQMEVYQITGLGEKGGKFASRKVVSAKDRIAVLPFTNISPDSADEYFADGITEELISTLSKVKGLKVISRTSAMHYKKTNKSASEISKELGVANLVEGSVRKLSNDVRVTVHLIDAVEDRPLWSQDYDRKLDNIFAIQKDIARRVVDSLRIRLLPDEMKDIERVPTASTEAHTSYLKGRYYWNERTKAGTDKAVKHFEQAVKLDPRFALAYAGLADCYILYGDYGWESSKEAYGKAKLNAKKSLDIDARIAEAHTSLADILAEFDRKWHDAEIEYLRAIELKPSYATAYQWYSIFLVVMNRLEEAYEYAKKANDLDPLSRAIGQNLGVKLLLLGNHKDAIRQFQKVIADNPDYAEPHDWLGFAYYMDSRTERAVDELRTAVKVSRGDPLVRADLACMLGLVGNTKEAQSILKDLRTLTKTNPRLFGQMALSLACIGRANEAFRYLERAFEERTIAMGVWALCRLEVFEEFRKDPRWAALRERCGLAGA